MEDPFNDIQEQIVINTSARTRSGYPITEMLESLSLSLLQSGAIAAGKCLHYSADLVCSGCFELWQKILWDFAFDHIGIASPRIFVLLSRRFQDLNLVYSKLPAESFYKSVDCQRKIAECVLVLRSCPRKPLLKMPKVPPQTHNDEWVRQSIGPADVSMPSALARVYKNGSDMFIVRRVGNEFVKACEQGATEKCFFWMKWLFEEEAFLRKETRGSLTTLERGPETLPPKARTHVSFFFASLLNELYKDFQLKGLVRMNEEFSELLQLQRRPNKQISQRRRLDCLCICVQILCEVPKWKVPAAPTLVADPVQLERATGHAEHFFSEVLSFAPPSADLSKEAKKTVPKQGRKTAKEKEKDKMDKQLAEYNSVINKMLSL